MTSAPHPRRLPQARSRGRTRRPLLPPPPAARRPPQPPRPSPSGSPPASPPPPPEPSSTASGKPTSAPASSPRPRTSAPRATAPPTPQLLDWLAVEFMDNGWHLKNLHRLIVKSSTYRQSSKVTPETLAKDPSQPPPRPRPPLPRRRRDRPRHRASPPAACSTPRSEAPASSPPPPTSSSSPPPATAPRSGTSKPGPERYRRALYTFRYRSVPYPALQAFDAPNGDVACVRRSRSNTPLQALTTLNEPVFLECARALAQTAIENGGDTDSGRLTYAFRRCLSRSPTDAERKILLRLLDRETDPLPATRPQPLQARLRRAHPPPRPAPAAWTAVARVLLNLDETISKE